MFESRRARHAFLAKSFLLDTDSPLVSTRASNAQGSDAAKPPEGEHTGLATFVQITDVHLFDEGKKRASKEEYLHDQQDNRKALTWAINQINHLVDQGRKIDFAVFTGGFGLELVRESESEVLCNRDDDKSFERYRAQGWPRFVPMRYAASEMAFRIRAQITMRLSRPPRWSTDG